MLEIILGGANDKNLPEAKTAQQCFIDAGVEAVKDLPANEAAKILRRAKRLHEEVLDVFDGQRFDKIGLVVFFALKAITDCDYVQIGEESAMRKGVELLLDALEPALEVEPIVASARKQARKLLTKFNELGYFRGVQKI
jgi:hypothetical protein